MNDKRQQQVIAQCRAVVHLSSVLADVHRDYMAIGEAGGLAAIVDIVGPRTAALMETLGDVLNSMDATDVEDEWLAPIFKEAQRLWPSEKVSA